MRLLVLAGCLAAAVHGQEDAVCDCSGAEARLAQLSAELKAAKGEAAGLRAELAEAKAAAGAAGGELSVMAAVLKTKSFAGDVVQHMLEQTTVDDQVLDSVSKHVSTAKTICSGVADKLSAVDYSGHLRNLSKHELYVKHVAPAVDQATVHAQPYWDKYVTRTWLTAQVYVAPAMEKAKAAYSVAEKVLSGGALPALRAAAGKALTEVPRIASIAEARLAAAMELVFRRTAKAAPKHAGALPKSPLDRLLAVLFVIIALYISVRWASFFARLALRIALRTTFVLFKLSVAIPLRLLRWVLRLSLSWFFFFATGLYCCGLCRSRKSKKKQADKGKAAEHKKQENGNAKKPAAPAQKVTTTELQTLLEASKKKGKLDPAVKLFCGIAGSGKPMAGKSFPDSVQDKLLDKDTLKKALTKFKEVDVKKLGL